VGKQYDRDWDKDMALQATPQDQNRTGPKHTGKKENVNVFQDEKR